MPKYEVTYKYENNLSWFYFSYAKKDFAAKGKKLFVQFARERGWTKKAKYVRTQPMKKAHDFEIVKSTRRKSGTPSATRSPRRKRSIKRK